jgi:amino acid adenylation domain-containing protein
VSDLENLLPDATRFSAQKLELLRRMQQEEGLDLPQPQRIAPRGHLDELPLSYAQQRLWFLAQLEPESPVYNIPVAYRLSGPLNVTALEQSLSEIARRHETLRTIFVTIGGQAVQRITPPLTWSLPVVSLQESPEAEREDAVRQLVTAEGRRLFDLSEGPLLRTILLRLDEETHVLLLAMHHIVSDGWSVGVFNRELSALYAAFSVGSPSPLPELPIQYADFALWQRQWLQGEVSEAQRNYWTQRLAGIPMLELYTDRPRPAVQTFRGEREAIEISKPLTEALKALSRQERVTLFMTLLAAFKVVLRRYTGQDDIPVGTPISNRNRVETEGLIGFFVNTLVLRTDLSGNPSFRELLRRVRAVSLEAYSHADLPFEKLVEELRPERQLSHNPLFQVMFVLQDAMMPTPELPGLTVSPHRVDTGTALFDLTLFMRDTERGLSGFLEYAADLFDAVSVKRLVRHLQSVLQGIVADPDQRLLDLPLLTEAERHQLLVAWNDTQADYAKESCIHELFEAQVAQTPEAVAVVCGESQLSYRELNTRANQLAHYLGALGVGPEVRVGICLERSLELAVGLLGILKAGGAYVPLDPSYPGERLTFMLADAGAAVLVTRARLEESLPAHAAQVVCLDTGWDTVARESEVNPASGVTAANLAYIIYTSGSTGRPKGVAIEHRSTVTLLEWAGELYTPDQLAAVLASTSTCFDLSIFELFVPLRWGGRVVLVENVLHLPTQLAAQEVTLVNTVSSAMVALLSVGGMPASVQTVNLAGEPLQNTLAQQIYRCATVRRVFNLYGPSEATTYSTFTLVRKGASESPSLGRPIANTQIYVLDAHLEPVPIGVPGQIYIGGEGLARGYVNRPELTAERFIPHPFSPEPGARLYMTGDLARYLPDGNIEFLGRLDHQVKIRGFRIEPGEIEAVLGQHPAVHQAVVLSREEQPGDKRLVAYVVPTRERTPTVDELRRFLHPKLPEYMVPSAFMLLHSLPLTPSGKIDRHALPAPDQLCPSGGSTFVAPRTPVEGVLPGIWAEVLGLEQVGAYDNFFEIGGHSLTATQVISRVRRAFDIELPLRRLFETPTVAGLAVSIELGQRQGEGSEALASILEELEQLSDDDVQARLTEGSMNAERRY